MKTKPNHRDGSQWQGKHDKRTYTMVNKHGKLGYIVRCVFISMTGIENIFTEDHGFTFIRSAVKLKPLPAAKARIKELEADLKTANGKLAEQEADRVAGNKSQREYYDRRIKEFIDRNSDLKKQCDRYSDLADTNARAHRNANATICAMKRQIELMGEALKISQTAVVA